jgi:transcriptional regulator with XRE-family HTH domain
VTHGHLVGIEADRRKLSADLILKIADIFGVTVDQLMRDDQEVD